MEQDTDQIRAKTTSNNGDISCTVEETNRIRAALGLKPLRTTKPQLPPTKPSEPTQQSAKQIREKLQASRTARRHRNAAIAPRSIAAQALLDDDDDDDEHALRAWVERSRIRSIPKTPQIDEQPPHTGKQLLTEPEKVGGSVAEDIDLSTGETKTLTLRDVDVIDTRHDVLEDHKAAEAFRRKNQEDEINGMVYDGTDKAQFERPMQKDGVQSLANAPRVVESDYKSDAIFRKVKKRSKKRRRTDPATVVPGTADALRKAADMRVTQESDEEEDDHYELLRKATAKAEERNVEGTVSRIMKAVQKAERGGDEEMQDGARLVEEEMAQYLGESDGEYSDSEDEGQGQGEQKPNAPKDEVRDDVKIEAKASEETAAKPPEIPTQPLAETTPEAGLETNGMTGIAATLARLRSKGELKQKNTQKGRAKDKRFNDSTGQTGKKEIKLSYVDEFGNQLTPKEAFRALCHSFHGKGPGQNKREKRLRKMLDAAKKRNMQSDDTPLASAAALKAETRRLGSAHVILSGSQALQIPLNAPGSASAAREGEGLEE